MRLTRTFRVSGILTAAGVLLVSAARHKGGWEALGIVVLLLSCPVFLVSVIRALLRGLLWRVEAGSSSPISS